MQSKIWDLDEARRLNIISAALQEFATMGYASASTNVIANKAGISKPLMFHYIGSKKELFLFLYDYCLEFLQKEYFGKINKGEKDIFARLTNTCLLKIEVLLKYPWIFDFVRMVTAENSGEVAEIISQKQWEVENTSFAEFFGDIETIHFKEGLDIEKAKELIFWAVSGYATKVLENQRGSSLLNMDYEAIKNEFAAYIAELKKAFYR
ncbi:TetR/AcrR family transcriptional regulator [Desulfoscipio gibsoniae]|uniref:Transcriptional regulator n=1 Tax=Desulfoscipio gibsoniae DSM 7213 TaxID=767817 RepID=R4KHV1_9FIRM|nr:TetR/AcrR family transcriptional regulator [Desulfoscipio gibsoniae]AGL02793.1 transcriptional regulator [Desulfoscipio gibsoniae DSM 7213]